jgi:hypothetical protein
MNGKVIKLSRKEADQDRFDKKQIELLRRNRQNEAEWWRNYRASRSLYGESKPYACMEV